MRNIISLAVLFVVTASIVACSGSSGPNIQSGSPMEAYQNLYKAVKSKNTDAIKANMTKATQGFVASAAKQNGKPESEVYSNGLTATTMSDKLPEMRDERINENFANVEVFNSRDKKWEDLPFVKEDGQWKLAIGELFANTFKSPGPGRAKKEAEAANVANGNSMTEIQPKSVSNSDNTMIAVPPAVSNSNVNSVNPSKKP